MTASFLREIRLEDAICKELSSVAWIDEAPAAGLYRTLA
jgi:hypothetical protein